MKKVSIIIPCRNEEKFIGRCLSSVVAQDFPKEDLEVLVIDGMSEDKTEAIIKSFSLKYPFIKMFKNPKKITPSALNIGIKASNGEIIIRMDAHATYKKDYVSKSVRYLEKYKADNIGGIWIIIPRKNTLIGKTIAKVMSSPFGAGNAYYKIGSEKLKEVDTVPFGCYRRGVFKKIGLFNENLVRSQDMEFNLRLKKSGGKIFLFPEIVGYYYVRSNLKDFFIHNFEDGIWSVYPLKFVKMPFKLRHYIPLIFVLGLFFSLILSIFSIVGKILFVLIFGTYLFFSLFFSLKIALIEGPKYFFAAPLVFFVRHFGYGLGSVYGLIKLFCARKVKKE